MKTTERALPINLPMGASEDFCRRHRLRKLSLFGSIIGNDFTPESDVDALVEFEPDSVVGLIGFARMEREPGEILGRRVDLNTAGCLSKYFVDEVHGIPGLDAFHLALATVGGAEVMLTVGSRLYKRAERLQGLRILPVEMPGAWLEHQGLENEE
ncbi:nucleotidyltransferase domain-containing protein [Candidatus Poribacteria bacterium]|nr:nucleotidyltransferase domain-containing protein [Candidatus Poribacteria bacterium]